MKTSELIKALQEEMAGFGDLEVVTFCPQHSGEDGDPIPVSGLGWYGNPAKNVRATFIECSECHYEGIADKIEGKYGSDMGEMEEYGRVPWSEE